MTAPRTAGRCIFSVPEGAGLAGEGLLEECDEAGQGFPSTPSSCQPCLCPPAHALQPSQDLVLLLSSPHWGKADRAGPLWILGAHVWHQVPLVLVRRGHRSHIGQFPAAQGHASGGWERLTETTLEVTFLTKSAGRGQLRREQEGRGGAGSSCRLQFPHISRSEPCAHGSDCAVPSRAESVGPTPRGPRGVWAAHPGTGTGQGQCRSTKSRLACSKILWLSRKYIPGQPPIRPQPD